MAMNGSPSNMSLAAVAALVVLTTLSGLAQRSEPYEQPPISYSATAPHGALAAIQARLEAGQLKLAGSEKEIVQSLLRELRVPIESQVLVFSKTSLQRHRIRPDNPRAVYFSDTCYVGWVPSGLVEIAAIDPLLGPVFYSFDPSPGETMFERDSDCLRCHGGNFVRGIPGVFARSIFTDKRGEPLFRFGSEVVDFRTPFENRWAGWYVTGKHGSALHRGNVLAEERDGELVVDLKRGANVTDLSGFFDPDAYLAPGSDIVALLVFEHQIAMQNTLTRASQDCRRMLLYQKNLQHDLREPVTEEPTYDSVKRVFESSAKAVVDDLLFKGEADLPQGLEGSIPFQDAFQAGTPRDLEGLSLKDLHLQGHLFQNRCSYLIYTEGFLSLPDILKKKIYGRLAHALHPTDPDPEYAYLGSEERACISSILQQTHSEIREAFSL